MNNRDLLRNEAKKAYKQKTKSVPKNKRMPFADFFKTFKRMKSGNSEVLDVNEKEDFNLDEFINDVSETKEEKDDEI